jgi:ABC-type transport system involved in cytochrome c biogenesis permease subunit
MDAVLLSEITALVIVVMAGAALGRHAWLLRCVWLAEQRVRWKSALVVAVSTATMLVYSYALYDDMSDGAIGGAALPVLVVRPIIIALLFALMLSGDRHHA